MSTHINLRIRSKLAVVFIVVLTLVIGTTSGLWYATARTILHKDLIIKQNQLGRQASQKIEGFLDAKTRALIIHSQSAAFLAQDMALQKLDLAIFLSQDQDLEQLTTISPQGQELLKLTRGQDAAAESRLIDRSTSPSFIANTFRYSKEFIGEVQFSPQGEPFLDISIPIKTPVSTQRLTELSTQASSVIPNNSDLLLGVLEAQVSLKNLFAEITDLGLDHNTSVFVVDRQGQIIGHKNPALVKPEVVTDKYPPVKQHLQTFVTDPIGHSEASIIFQYRDETGTPVLGSHSAVAETGWAIVAQQSAAQAYADLNHILWFAIALLLGTLVLAFPFAFFLSEKITTPVLALTSGANTISQGQLDYRIQIHTHDELQDLAEAFNTMTQKLQDSIGEIKSEKTKLEVVVLGIEDAVIAVNKHQQIVLINPAGERLIELKSAQVLNRTLAETFSLFDTQAQIPANVIIPPTLITPAGIVFDRKALKLTTSAGVEKFINLVSGKIRENQHSDVDYILTIHDVTAEQKLEAMKMDFVSMAAHELRTPITSITGYASTLLAEAKQLLPPASLDMLAKVHLNGLRLSTLVDNLLNVASIERGDLKTQLAPMDLVACATSAIADLRPQADAKHQTLTYLTPTVTSAAVLGDSFQLTEVFTNLLSNAIKYTPDHGSITVSITNQSTSYQAAIADTGVGIPAEAQTRLFTKFFRAVHGLEQEKGTGLGLYISKAIITQHHGTIHLTSVEGHGTTVYFELPAYQGPLTSASPAGILHNPSQAV